MSKEIKRFALIRDKALPASFEGCIFIDASFTQVANADPVFIGLMDQTFGMMQPIYTVYSELGVIADGYGAGVKTFPPIESSGPLATIDLELEITKNGDLFSPKIYFKRYDQNDRTQPIAHLTALLPQVRAIEESRSLTPMAGVINDSGATCEIETLTWEEQPA